MDSFADAPSMSDVAEDPTTVVARGHLRGLRLALARAAVAATTLLVVAAFAASLPGRFDALRTGTAHPLSAPTPAYPGLSSGAAAYLIGLEVAVALVFLAVAALIFARRSDDAPAALAAATLASFGVALPGTTFAIARGRPIWETPFPPAQALGWALLLLFAYTFPEGSFRPRWTRPLAVLWVAWVFEFFFAGPRLAQNRPWLIGISFGVWVAWFATGALAQAYRYVRIATYAERQQTKWVVVGFLGAIAGTLAASLPGIATLTLGPAAADTVPLVGAAMQSEAFQVGAASLASATALLIPLTIGIAILRHRLFDVDLLIHRALVYGTLTGAVAAFYAVCIMGVQFALGHAVTAAGSESGALSSPALVATTLATIALVRPLRRRIQAGIDRRFYRRQYDAARVVAAFGSAMRGQVELPELHQSLLAAVEETMRPAHVSLWLRSSPGGAESALRSSTPPSPGA